MVTVIFQCSSPFVGYTLRIADYKNQTMQKCSAEQMTPLGYKIFSVSGTYSILMRIQGRRYFHARQFRSEAFDEQGRRIYTNVAFIGEPGNSRDDAVINRIAAYEFFETDVFYKEIASMIRLTETGFTVAFDLLAGYLKQFENDLRCITKEKRVTELYGEILRDISGRDITFVVLEATWEYFCKQAGTDFKSSVNRRFTLEQAKQYAARGRVEFAKAEEKNESACTAEEKDDAQREAADGDANTQQRKTENVKENEMIAAMQTEIETLNGRLRNADGKLNQMRETVEKYKRFIFLSGAIGAVLAAVIEWIIIK